MKTVDIRLEVKLWGSLHNCHVYLENMDKIGLWSYDSEKNIHYRDLPNYEINGNLDVKMEATGKNGASSTLVVKIKGQDPVQLICLIQNGHAASQKSITINELI